MANQYPKLGRQPPQLRHTAMVAAAGWLSAVGACERPADPTQRITISGSAVGAEADVLKRQLKRFMLGHPHVRVELLQTPDAAEARHQLYVQWLNAGVGEPDILQLDVIWIAEFAAAGWLHPLDGFAPDTNDYFPAALRADRWNGRLFALPWFVDVGMIYWRTDLLDRAPASLDDLMEMADQARGAPGVYYGLVWQAARYEGLMCIFLEVLHAFGGRIVDADGSVAIDSREAVAALTFMRDAIHTRGVVPDASLTWQEEQVRFAFQNGQAAMMRNWPYAYGLMQDPAQSRVAGKFSVMPIPAGPGGTSAAALGGSHLAINAHSPDPQAAYKLLKYLVAPQQMLERARGVGQFPSRQSLYEHPELAEALAIPPAQARQIINHAVPRPVTPVYAELSELVQVAVHRVLTRQAEPAVALRRAADEVRSLLVRTGLSGPQTEDDPAASNPRGSE